MRLSENSRKATLRTACFTAAGLLWLAVFPLWQGGTYAHITHDKWIGAVALTGATAVLTLAGLLAGIRAESAERRPQGAPEMLHSWIPLILACCLFLWMGASSFLGSYHAQLNGDGQPAVWMGARRYEGMATQLCYFAIFLCLSLRKAWIRIVTNGAAAVMLVYTLIVFLQYAGLNPLGLFPGRLSVRTNYEFQGTIGNIDMVSGYAVLVTALTLGSFLTAKRAGWLLYAGGLAGVLLECCMEVQSGLIALAAGCVLLAAAMLRRPELRFRGWLAAGGAAVMALARSCTMLPWLDGSEEISLAAPGLKHLLLTALAALCFLMACVRSRRPGRAATGRQLLILLLAAALLAAAVIAVCPFPEGSGLWEIGETLKGRPQDSFGSWRLGVWRFTLQLASENLLWGTGPDTFWYAFNPRWSAYEQRLQADGALAAGQRLERFDTPHNEYLAILSNNGLPALILYLALLTAVLRRLFRAGRSDPGCAALAAAIVMYMVQGFFSFSICLTSPMFWAVLGMAAAMGRETHKEIIPC